MASFSYAIPLPIRCSTGSNNQDPNKQSLNKIKSTGSPKGPLRLIYLAELLGWQKTFVASVQNDHISKEQIRQNIPTKKQLVDYHRQGLIIEGGVGYRQTVVIRSYEVGSDKTAALESIVIFSR
jgi:fatty acyl-ACP thioesterase B